MCPRLACILSAVALANSLLGQTLVPFSPTPDHRTDVSGVTTGGAFADLDRDGWPDLVVANGNDIRRQRVAVYYNQGDGRFPVNPDWQSADVDYHGHLDVGDVDGDGWLDVAVSVYLGPAGFSTPGGVKLYLNDGAGALGGNPAWTSGDRFYSFSCALGDVDGDGDLDLAAAAGEPYNRITEGNRLYLNQGGTFGSLPAWTTGPDHSMDVAWRDVDGDGDLDLAFAGARGPNRLYLNQGGILPSTPSWQSTDGGSRHSGNSCAFADVDGDGLVDFAVSDNSQLGGRGTFRVYRNTGAAFTTTPWWESSVFQNGYTSAVGFCDFDRDGDQDLVAGGWWTSTVWYRNGGGTLQSTPVWQTSGTSVVEAVFLADVNRDGLRTVTGEQKVVGGGRKLFSLDHDSVESLERVVADGTPLLPSQYAFHREGGWLSLAVAPAASLTIDYTYTEAADLGVTNWDRTVGNFVFLRMPLVDIALVPPPRVDYRAGELVQWTEGIRSTAANLQFGVYHSILTFPNNLGSWTMASGSAWLPGGWVLPSFPQALRIPNPLSPVLLGEFDYRVGILGLSAQRMSSGSFRIRLVP